MVAITEHASLKPYNTFGLDAQARFFTEVRTVEELQEVLRSDFAHHHPLMVLGGGSNVLFRDDYDGLVVLNRIGGIAVTEETKEYAYVRAGGGEAWHGVVRWAVDHNYGGIENMSLIPGCVGAGPIQNIGAYGAELKDVFHTLEAVEVRTGKVRTFTLAECRFGYRESVFKRDLRGRYVIAAVSLRLVKNPVVNTQYGSIKDELAKRGIEKPTIRDVSDAVIAIRRSKLPEPHVLGNAGSFFKNPVVPEEQYKALLAKNDTLKGFPAGEGFMKLSAGWLIEQCGWKGKKVGHTGAHKDQALVLVNYGGATGPEVYALALEIRKSVMDRFGVELEMEVNLVGG